MMPHEEHSSMEVDMPGIGGIVLVIFKSITLKIAITSCYVQSSGIVQSVHLAHNCLFHLWFSQIGNPYPLRTGYYN